LQGPAESGDADAKILAQIASMVADAPGDAQCTLIAAKQGDAEAERQTGERYYAGNGVAKDAVQAVFWFKKSVDQKDTTGMLELASMYEKGEGVPKDLLTANYLRNSATFIARAKNPQFKGGVGSPGLAALGNLLGYAESGQAASDDTLEATVDHQKAVLDLIAGGRSRVDAEQLLFDEEEKEDRPRTDECTAPEYSPKQYGESDDQQRARNAHGQYEYDSCVQEAKTAWKDKHNQRVDYMQCVIDNVDSNVIETKCKYHP
jgi:hypothetical protein